LNTFAHDKSYYKHQQHRGQLTQLFDEWWSPVHHGCVMAGTKGCQITNIQTTKLNYWSTADKGIS